MLVLPGRGTPHVGLDQEEMEAKVLEYMRRALKLS